MVCLGLRIVVAVAVDVLEDVEVDISGGLPLEWGVRVAAIPLMALKTPANKVIEREETRSEELASKRNKGDTPIV